VVQINKKQKWISGVILVLGLLLMSVGVISMGSTVADKVSLIMVSHSEYVASEQGQIIGKLYNYKGLPILADCNVTIYNPDKTIFLAPTPTDDTLETLDGTHYINFTTPTVEGVYEYKLDCSFPNSLTTSRTISNSFHLSPALNTIVTVNGTVSSVAVNLQNLINYVNTNFTYQNQQLVYQNGMLVLINTTTKDILANVTGIDTQVKNIWDNMFTDLDAYNNFTVIDNNFVVVNNKLDALNLTMQGLSSYCSDAITNSSMLCQYIYSIDAKQDTLIYDVEVVMENKLDVINSTVNGIALTVGNIYTDTQNILIDTGIIKTGIIDLQAGVNQINTTVNNIDTNVNDIKTNITTVITNQEDMVYIDVTS
jgi:hypothetical protein